MSVRGFYGGTKINGTLKKSVELTINDDNRASLKLNDAEVKTKETRVLYNDPESATDDQDIIATLHDGGEYLIVSSNETYFNIGLSLALPMGAAYASVRLALVLFKTGSNASIDWSLTNPYWVSQADPTQSPTFDVVADTPAGKVGMIYHVVLERFGHRLAANVAYKMPFQEPDLPDILYQS